MPDRYGVYQRMPGSKVETWQLVLVTLNRARAIERANSSVEAFAINGGPRVSFRHTMSAMDARNAETLETL